MAARCALQSASTRRCRRRAPPQVHFEWVKSEANIADLPTRGQFELLQEFASKEIPLIVPPISDWLTPDETVAHVFSGPLSQKRGGKRGRG